MDPKKLFADQRLSGFCVYCGGPPATRDHVPSRILLDDPFPNNLHVVECCEDCNSGFSLHEEYLACFIDCVLAGSTIPDRVARPKVSRILTDTPTLATRIANSLVPSETHHLTWMPEMDRIRTVLLKLARGHIAYELISPRLDEPDSFECIPLSLMSARNAEAFLDHQQTPFWPEIGSRAFIRACQETPTALADHWQVVQKGRYQYLVSQSNGDFVRILLSNYLACEVRWE